MVEAYPELEESFSRVLRAALAEESGFRKTLDSGSQVLAEELAKAQALLPGEVAFLLHDTYGFPIDLTMEIASESGKEVDRKRFDELMGEQRARAKQDAKSKRASTNLDVYAEFRGSGETKFLGYESLTAEAKVIGLIHDGQSVEELVEGQIGEVILDRTSLYAESGGQIADAGQILAVGLILEVLDVQKPVKGLFSHQVRVVQGSVAKADAVLSSVYHDWRVGACQAHSATHVVHAALRQVLGPNALQSGSYNRPGYMRLDFAWGEALSEATKSEIEEVSNLAIRADLAVSAQFMTLPEAKEWGAIALFGETYDEQVRVVQVGGPWSRELCGGTHVSRTAQIGLVSVSGESSVGSGVRRIEAEVGIDALRNLLEERAIVRRISTELKTPVGELEARITESLESYRTLEKELAELRLRAAKDKLTLLYGSATEISGKRVLASQIDGIDSAETLRQLALTARDSIGSLSVVILGANIDSKPVVMVAAGKDAVANGVSAGVLAKRAAEVLGGGGGGKPDFAQGGGTATAKLSEAIQASKGLVS
jgi:alanyl-tRNA synthetase